jgi:hypothetical protein
LKSIADKSETKEQQPVNQQVEDLTEVRNEVAESETPENITEGKEKPGNIFIQLRNRFTQGRLLIRSSIMVDFKFNLLEKK